MLRISEGKAGQLDFQSGTENSGETRSDLELFWVDITLFSSIPGTTGRENIYDPKEINSFVFPALVIPGYNN